MLKPKIYYVLRAVLFAALLGLCGGVLFWAGAYAVEIFDVLLIAIGVLCVVMNLPTFLLSLRGVLQKKKWEWISLIVALCGIVLGTVFASLPRDSVALPVLLLLYAVVLPAARIILVEERARQFRRESPKLLIAAFLFVVSAFEMESVLLFVLGIVCISIGVLHLLLRLVCMRPYFKAYEEALEEFLREQEGEGGAEDASKTADCATNEERTAEEKIEEE